jgi:hypothetical protein
LKGFEGEMTGEMTDELHLERNRQLQSHLKPSKPSNLLVDLVPANIALEVLDVQVDSIVVMLVGDRSCVVFAAYLADVLLCVEAFVDFGFRRVFRWLWSFHGPLKVLCL